MRAKLFLQWFLVIVLFAAVFFSFLSVFLSPSKPVRFSEIPQETKDYFGDLIGKFGFDIKFVDLFDDDAWQNDHDFGQDSLAGLAQLQDSNFIVYYDSAVDDQIDYAKHTLTSAQLNILPLNDLFGRYIYPAEAKGRKLPIYLANSSERFNQVYSQLLGHSTDTEWMAGICITSISSTGEVITNGIILKTYGPSSDLVRFTSNLKHEMAHYVHLHCVDWLKTYPLIWETEGFAMYFEGNKETLKSFSGYANKSLSKISLSADVENYLDSYWVGYTVMLFVEQAYNKGQVKKYIRNSYTMGANENIETTSRQNVRAFEARWKDYVEAYF